MFLISKHKQPYFSLIEKLSQIGFNDKQKIKDQQINLSMNKKQTQSDFQKMFTTQSTFRRNKHYYDAIKMSAAEHTDAQRRRKPKDNHRYPSDKIQTSFQSAKKQRQYKVVEDISKFKFRMSFYSPEKNPESSLSRSKSKEAQPTSPKNIKGVPHQKFLSRESLHNLRNKPCKDQRQFTNFYIKKHDLSHIPDIGKFSPRNLNIANENMTDLYYNSQKKYEECYFDNRVNSCTFELKKQNDNEDKQRYFFNPKRQEDKAQTDLKPDNVAKSFSVANPYKPNKILNFYKLSGREMPSQYDKRHYSPNKNFYYNKEGRLVKPEVSFTARRYKDELLVRDIEDIKKAKRPYFGRDEVCDQMYFKQEKRKF